MSLETKINSISAITWPMMAVILAYAIKAAVLFFISLEIIPNDTLRIVVSSLLGLPVGATLLVVTVNRELMNTGRFPITETFAIMSFVMMLIIFGVFENQYSTPEYIRYIFLSGFMAFVEYTYSRLFVAKYRQSVANSGLSSDYDRLKSDYHILLSSMEGHSGSELLKFKKALECPSCGQQHDTVSRYRNCKHEM